MFTDHSAYWRKMTLRQLITHRYLLAERGTHGQIMRYTLLHPLTGIPLTESEKSFSDIPPSSSNPLLNKEKKQNERISTDCTVLNTTHTLLYSDQNNVCPIEKPLFCETTRMEIDRLAREARVSVRWLTQLFANRCEKFPATAENEHLIHLHSMIQYVATQKFKNFASYLEYCYMLSYEEFKFPATFGVESIVTPPHPQTHAPVMLHATEVKPEATVAMPQALSSARFSEDRAAEFCRILQQEDIDTFDATLKRKLSDANVQLTRKVLARILTSEQKAAQLHNIETTLRQEHQARCQQLVINA